MVNPSQFLDPDVFLVVSSHHLLDSYLHPSFITCFLLLHKCTCEVAFKLAGASQSSFVVLGD